MTNIEKWSKIDPYLDNLRANATEMNAALTPELRDNYNKWFGLDLKDPNVTK